jgi:hypothetical protein
MVASWTPLKDAFSYLRNPSFFLEWAGTQEEICWSKSSGLLHKEILQVLRCKNKKKKKKKKKKCTADAGVVGTKEGSIMKRFGITNKN